MLSGFREADRERAARRKALREAERAGAGATGELAGRMAELDAARERLEQARQEAERTRAEAAGAFAGRMTELDTARERLEQARQEAEQARDEYRQKATETAAAATQGALHMTQNALNGGEISPEMAARVDQPRYQTGCETLENMVPLPQGGISKRPGLEHVADALAQDADAPARLIPFVFNAEETRVLELAPAPSGAGTTLRVWRPTETGAEMLHRKPEALPWPAADMREADVAQSADVLFFAHRLHAPAKLSRYADDDWRFETVDWMPGIAAPTIVEAVPVGNIPNGENSRTNYSYVATAVDGTTGEESMPSPVVTVENVAPLSQSYYIRITISPVEGASEYRIYKKKGGVYGYIGRITGDGQAGIRAATMTVTMPAEPLSDPTYYINVELSGFVEPVSFEWRDGDIWTAAPQVGGSLLTNKGWRKNGESWQLVSARMPAGGDPKKQWLPGERMRVCDSGGTPVEITLPDWRKKATAKRESGAVLADTFEDRNIGADTEDTPPEARNPFDGEGNYPSAVFLHQQRLGFAASDNQPLTVWLSQAGNFESMAASIPPSDDDAIEVTLATEQANRILWCRSDRSVLALGTAGGEWTLSGADGGALTPSSLSFQPQTFYGSEVGLRPLRVGQGLVFVQRGGVALREYGYSFSADRYESGDLSLLARHILRESPVVSWAWQGEPRSVLWCVRADGSLAGLTCMREHDVVGWHRHATPGGRLESVISLPGTRGETLVWFLVWRNGSRRIERLARFFEGGDPARSCHADGRERLPYTGRCVPCMPETTLQNGSSLMRVRKLNAVKCRVINSAPFAARVGNGPLLPVPAQKAAYTARADWAAPLAGGWRDGGKLELVFDGQNPVTLLAVLTTVEVADLSGAQG